MKRLMLFLVLSASAFGQQNFPNMILRKFSGAPTGSCSTFQFAINTSTGSLYDCVSGSWNAIGGAAVSTYSSGGTTLNQVPKSDGAGRLQDSIALSEAYPTFTVNESQTTNGTQSVIGDIRTTQLTAPSTLACVQGAATGGFLNSNQAYFYKVTALSGSGETTVSNESTFTTSASPAPNTYTANCTWTGHSGDTGYKIYRSTTTGTETLLATITPGNVNSYTDNTNTVPSGAMPTANTTGKLGVATAPTAGAPFQVGSNAYVNTATAAYIFGASSDPATLGQDGVVGLFSTDTATIDGGASLIFGGGYSGTSLTKFAAIKGAKENGTPADVAGYLNFYTRPTGGAPVERFRLSSTGAATFTPGARSSGTTSYFTVNIPADTGITASTESIGFQTVTGTRTWADGTVALQRENFFAGPTYNKTTTAATFTDPFTMYITPPVAGTGVTFTRGHSLGIVDSTSAASSITGGLVVAATLGTAATSVGIGGGNVNAGGTITAAGVSKLGNTTLLTADSTGITATTPGTIIFTLGAMAASTNYAFHCAGTYSQATAAVANGVSIQGATNAPTRLDAWYNAYTSNAGASVQGNVVNLTSTTQTALSGTFTPSATATVFGWEIMGVVQNGSSPTTLKIGFFTGNASDALTIKAGSYCTLLP